MVKLLPSGRPPEAQPCCKEPDSQVEVVTSHKTLRKQALLSAVKGVLTLFNRKVLNLHKQGSALRKVTPGLHTKRAGNTNIRHQILVLWKMTRQGDQRSIVSTQRPDSLTRTLRRGCLTDKQHPCHYFLGSPRLTLPPTSQPFTKAGPHPLPQPPSSHLPPHYPWGMETSPPPTQSRTPWWGGSLSNTNTQFTLESPKSPWGLRWGQVSWAATLALATRTPDQGRDKHSRNALLRTLDSLRDRDPDMIGGLPQPSPAKCVPLASHGGSPNIPIHSKKSQYRKKDQLPQLDNLQTVDS